MGVRKKGVSPKLCSKWTGPCTVLQKLSDVVYRVQMLTGRKVVLHRDRLAPYQPRAETAGSQGEAAEGPAVVDACVSEGDTGGREARTKTEAVASTPPGL